ncbi:hypothetical protein H1S01_12625 [Heliobacterium chlorum]|uniref:Uncharacterized protein n=1 Tax=Heliobacterium chlorum TaxID=2698 RepID=A0ABR7T3L6_HELCL|nr:hypothetical protein [Heliobacterium chlorum]MBC9785354.1 hypothetical protein [Heliobacterium chlorum]
MIVTTGKDLFVDERGNYFIPVHVQNKEVQLANAFNVLAFENVLDQEYYDEHKNEKIGFTIANRLKARIELFKRNYIQQNIYPLEELYNGGYEVAFVPVYEPSV